ncbi:YDG domain-containing protein, partial [Polynucleobacter sp. AP-Capit-er-40B-B4]|uniref:beta strand repeat-containing protein n=1 Tax=Polynucleobacter sp. AP-Capit-er-40B-B4 TaxID=2576927 RepID=UPI001C0ABC5F
MLLTLAALGHSHLIHAQNAVNALPTGGRVAAGQAVITQTSNATSAQMNINQSSQRAVINWDSFNVGKNAAVNFNQPNANAVTLNRVTGASASMIDGAVRANGQVIFVNPNGVTFGRGAEVNAAAVVATTMNIADKDFMDGKSTFKGNGQGAVINQGKIVANDPNGFIALLAPEVRNEGFVLAHKGPGNAVVMAAGEQITLNFQGNQLVGVKVDVGVYNGLIENKRVVEVNGGLVVVAAGSANKLMASVIKNTGRISAGSAVNNGGVIELVAANVTQAGTVSANAKAAGTQGGLINIVGENITLTANSKTVATGAAGGGQVNVGLGATSVSAASVVNHANVATASQLNQSARAASVNLTTSSNALAKQEMVKQASQLASNNGQMAKTVTIEAGAKVDVSATQSGDGGSIAIWSQVKTIVAGTLKATGGILGGNGGFIETSSKGNVTLAPALVVDTSAAKGKPGLWFLDPIDLIIDSTAAGLISSALTNNNVSIAVNGNVCPSIGACTQNGSGSLTIANGADILKQGTSLTTLTLTSSGIFNLNANIAGENLNVIISSSIAYLNVGTTIAAKEVTVVAQAIYANGSILTQGSDPLGGAINLLAQAIWVSGSLNSSAQTPVNSTNSSTNTGSNSSTTTGGLTPVVRPNSVVSLNSLISANGLSGNSLDQVYSSVAANDPAIQTQVLGQASSNVIRLIASQDLTLASGAQLLANGTTGNAGGQIYLSAPNADLQSGSLIQANGNNGPGGLVSVSGKAISVAGNIAANGEQGGRVNIVSQDGNVRIQNALIQTNGSAGRGGSIAISAANDTSILGSTIASQGANQGGQILIGNDANHKVSNLTVPFSVTTTIDANTLISTKSISTDGTGGFIETSGNTLHLLGSINAGRGGMWLLDPTNVTITAATSTGGVAATTTNSAANLTAAQGQAAASTFNTADIQNAINAGTSVTITASGTITQTTALVFNITGANLTPTLTLNNTSGSKQSITLISMTDSSTGAGSKVSLSAISAGGTIAVNGVINLKGAITLDNTYGAASGPPASGYITVGNVTTLATTTGAGVNITSALTSGGLIVVKGVATGATSGNAGVILNAAISGSGGVSIMGIAGGANGAVVLSATTGSITSSAGNISLDATTLGAANLAFNGTTATTISATAGSVSIVGRSVGGTAVNQAGAITGKSIDITGIATGAPTTNVSLGAMTIVAGGSNISVTASSGTAGANTGIYQIGTITDNAVGSSISFTSNNLINQTGAIALVANTGTTEANVIFDATTGTKTSNITTGNITVAAGTNTSAINYIVKSAGSAINPGSIGSTTVALPGYVLLDNTYGAASGSPASGYITTSNAATLATASTALTINGAIYAAGNITANGISNSAGVTIYGIDYSVAILSKNGDVSLNGVSTAARAVYNSIASTITGNNITIIGTTSALGFYAAQINSLSINSTFVGGDISVTGNVLGATAAAYGIYQAGNITGANGSNISFISNTTISQTGVIILAANTSSTAANITYDTTTGNKLSTITPGTLTIATGSTSAINYIVKSSGAFINPAAIGTSTNNLPGYVLLDNTYGCTPAGCTPVTGFINTTAGNLASLATTSTGVTLNAAIYAAGNITVNAVSTAVGIDYSVAISSKNGDVSLNGSSTANRAVYNSIASTITANNIAIVGTTSALGYWTSQIGALTINSTAIGGSISITGNVLGTTAAAYGIYQAGAITGASGSNMSFISNKRIDQNGIITLAINTSGTAANITYNTTTGNSTSTINTGVISLAAGSTAGINYSVLSAGSAITIGGAVVVPGAITLANTFGCSAADCTPFSGYLNKDLTSWTTLVTASNGVTVSAALSGTAITINGISSSGRSVLLGANLTATSGNINILGTSNTGPRSVTNHDGAAWLTSSITANSGAVNITGISTTTGDGVLLGPNTSISAKSITVIGSEVGGAYAVYLDALTIVAGGTNINITGTVAVNTHTGIYQAGAIADNAAGSNISFITNGKINQLGAIALVANTTSTAVSVTYNTTSGTKDSSVVSGALTIAAGANASPINYIIKTAGAAINPAAIGTSTVNLPGYVLLDNTYGCAGAGCTPVTGFINTSSANLLALATASTGVTINGAVYATGNITVNGVASAQNGIDYSVAITSTGGSVILNGGTTTLRGVYNSVASTITANNITIIGTSSGNPSWDVQIGALTINSASIGGSITVTGNYIGTPGALGGIYQIGTITGASGSNISFISNNNIQQNGAIVLALNTSGAAANITYDVTTGNKTSSILAGALTIATGTNTSPINYIIKSAGSAINPAAIGTSTVNLPGYVLLDNTYGCAGVGCTPMPGFINTTSANLVALATTSVGVTINNPIYANGNVTVNAISTSNALDYSYGITSKNGDVILNGGTTTIRGVYNSVASTITANNITIIGTSSGNPSWDVQIGALTINSASIGGSITVTGNYIGTPGALGGIYQIGTITGASGSNISFISNNNIQQNGAIVLALNTSGAAANITYDVTTGNKTSSILAGALTIATGTNTSPINYIIKSAGSAINPAAIGTSTLALPGYVLIDNTYGCTASTPACTPVSGFINTAIPNLSTLATASVGITINNAIYASGNITVNGVTGGAGNTGIDYSVAITSSGGNVILNGGTTDGRGVYNSLASIITANNITITGTSTLAAVWDVQIGGLTINSGAIGGGITVTGNVLGLPGAAGGIYQIGTITGANGSSIRFISNNDIDQNGAINLLANTSGVIASIIFDTTTGNNISKVSSGVVSIGTGTSTAAINYLVKTNGAIISVPAITVPGYILLDDTCLGCTTVASTSTAAANGAAISITGALSAGSLAGSTGVTINAVANGTGIGFTQGANAISSAAGGVTITVNGQTGTGYSSALGNITATGQAITITTTTTTAAGINDTGTINGGVVTLTATQSISTATATPITATGLITANSLTVSGTGGAATTIVSLGAITINAGGGNITVTANDVAAGTNTGITQTGTITDNAVGSNISFISNNDINQNGAITLVANTGTTTANIIYDTTAGNSTSTIGTGAVTIGAGTSTSAINYLVKTNGGTISVPAISVPGYILLDNTCLGCTTAATTSTAAANGAVVTITGALSAGSLAGSTGVTINAVANGSGIGFTQGANAISSLAGGITITVNGQTGTAYSSTGNITAIGQAITITTATTNVTTTSAGAGINDTGTITGGVVSLTSTLNTATATTTPITATGLITANSLTVTGTGGASATIVSLGAITINAGGGNITVTANDAAPGANTGITQTGAITDNAVGSSISFISNNKINQTGAIALVANTNIAPANIIYNTTTGSNASAITAGALSVTGTSTATINYLVKTNGAIISVPAITVPGYIVLDNTCLGCSTAATTSTAAANGAAVTITGALSAGSYAGSTGVTINAVANGSGIGFTQGANAISSLAGGVTIAVNGQTGAGYSSSGAITAVGQAITISSRTTSGGNGIYNTGAITGGAVTLTSVKVSATATMAHIVSTGLITANSLVVSSSGGLSATLVSLGAITINVGGGNIFVTAMADTATAGTDVGIYQSGAITDNAAGSNISFITNNVINQVGAITVVSSAGAPAANVTYDTTSGTKAANISGGALTIAGTGSIINYIAKSAGSVIWTPAIGIGTAPLPGYVSLDNTYGCTAAPCTPTAGFITASNAATLATASTGVTTSGAIYTAGNITINGISTTASGVTYSSALNTTGGGITITGVSVGAAATSNGINASSATAIINAGSTTDGVVQMYGTSTASTGTVDAIKTVASATISGNAGVYIFGMNASGNITLAALVKNAGTNRGVTVNSTGNVNIAGVTNSGVDGTIIVAGRGQAAGVITGGDITAVGTLTNTGGVIAISMAKPGSATGDVIATALGITSANANATTNIAYGIAGGTPVQPGGYAGGNYINYRQKITSTLAISVTLNSNYSAVYGTAYNSNAANDWLQANATVSYAGTTTATFGLSAPSLAYAKSVLVFSPTVGGSTALNGTNANAVQSNTTLTATSLSATDGTTVTLSGTARTYTIAPAVLGLSVTAVYNGTTTLTNPVLATTGLAAWDRITSVTVNVPDANGASTYVTAIGGTSTVGTFSASNYLINTGYSGTLVGGIPVNAAQATATNKVSISPAPLGITVNAVYSGTATIAPSAFTVTGLVNGQTITAISAATINSANVSANNGNYVSAITVGGGTASIANYNITTAYNTVAGNTQNTVTLTPKSLTVTGITIGAKTYDGTTSAVVTGGSLVGVAAGDIANVTLTQAASFALAAAANNVAITMVDSIAGTASANYTLVQPTGITANIARKAITVGGTSTAASKVYDGTTSATVTGGVLVGVITADLANISLTQSGTFAQSGVGTAISVLVSATIGGTASSNYVVSQPANLSANISTKVLTVTGTAVTDKVYNGATVASITGGVLVGVITADLANVNLTQAGTFASPNAGNAVAVTMSDAISGSASGNYSLVQPTGITGKITPAPLGISVAAIYSGSTTVTPTTFTVTGLVNGETITGVSSAVLDSMNVGANSSNFVRSIVISAGTANAGNYTFGTVANSTVGNTLNTVALTPKVLTVTGTLADKKVYDGATGVTVWGGSLVGVIGVDVVVLKQAGTLNSANAGAAVPVIVNDTISGFSAGNYSLVQPIGVVAAVTPKAITISDGTVANKVYDGTTNAVLTGGALVGVLPADAPNVILTQAGRFSSPNVSNGIIIIASGSISGSAASNYTLIQPAGITANITPAMLGISVVGVANGTNTITPISFTINGLINGQTITGLSSVTVKSSSISSNGSNFVTSIVISGGTALATNYAFGPAYNATAGISQNTVTLVNASQKILTVTGTVAVTKTYDGTTSIVITGGTLVGVMAGDTVNLVQSAVLINPNVSTAASVVISDSITGTSAANYILIQPSGITAIVNPAPLGIAVTGAYNGTTTITPTTFTATGLVNGETITGLSSVNVSNANVSGNGSNYVAGVVSNGGTAVLSNYSITSSYNASAGNTKNTASITPKALTVGGVSVVSDKVYDGTTAAVISGGSLVGVIGADVVNMTQAGAFAQVTVGNGVAVVASNTLDGASASNYSLIQPTGLTGNITPKALTVNGVTVANKVYDGTTSAVVTGGSLLGLVGSDGANVTLNQVATFASSNVGNNIAVTLVDAISGSLAGNYTVIQPVAVSANITPKALTVSGSVVSNKVYDGTTAATVTAGTLLGVVATDAANVTLSRAGAFTSSNVATGITIAMNDSISGSAASNYTLTQPSGVTASITPKALTITASNVSSIYGSTTSLGNSGFTQSGLLSGDSIAAVTLLHNGSSAVSATVNAGTYSAAIIPSAATGNGLSNYTISYVGGDLTVGQATLTLTPINQSAAYNGNTLNAATYSAVAANYMVSGYQNTDSASNVTFSFTGSLGFTSNGSSASVLNAGAYGYTAGNLAITTTNTNYRIVLASTLSNQYTVTPAIVSLSASKVYDGTRTFAAGASGTTYAVTTGVGSQTLSVSGSALANDANVIGVSSLNTSGLILVDGTGSAANFMLPASTSNVVITPKLITVAISSQTKLYDTTTAAVLMAGTSSADGAYTLTGFVGNDGAYITQTVGSYNSANVASATTLTALVGSSYVARGGAVLSNYVLPTTASTISGGATITPAPLTMTASDVSTYVGIAPTFGPSSYQLTGLLGADIASSAISNPAVTYNASLLTTAMNAPAPNALIPNATSSNYSLTFVGGSLMVAGNRQMIISAGSNTASYGVVNSANASYLGDALAGTNAVTAGYCTNCAVGVTTPNIIALTITAPSAGSNVWTATDALGSGPNSGQGKYTFVILPTTTGSYNAGNNLNVGNYVLTASSLATVANYTTNYDTAKAIIYNNGVFSVTPKVITVGNTVVVNKSYDGTNAAVVTGGQLIGVVSTDYAQIGLVQGGSFASINAANGIAVTISNALTGTAASNYVLTQPTGITANITAAPVTITGLTASNKTYDNSTPATVTGTPVVIGLLGSDAVTLSGTISATFAQSNAGNGLPVTANFSNYSLGNSNYAIAGVTTALSANITPAPITITAVKTYDGSNTLAANQMTIAGVAGQTLTFAAGSTGTLSNPNVGSATLVGLNQAVLANGTGLASNYTVVNPSFGSVTINPAAITVGLSAITKVYDKTLSTASASVAPSPLLISGTLFLNEDSGAQDSLSGGTFAYLNANAGINKTVSISNASVISGASTVTHNYSITYQANTASEITAAPVAIGGLTAANKVYDASTLAALIGTPTITGLLAGDNSTVSGNVTGSFANANVGTGIAVTANLSGLTLSNPNYYVTSVASPLGANITPAPVTITGLSAANKVYDTNTTATLTGTPAVASGLLNGDVAAVTGAAAAGTFASANVGTGLTVTANLSALSLSNNNYYINGVAAPLTANITPAPVIISGLSALNKVYDTNRVAVLSGTSVVASGVLGSDAVAIASGAATAGSFASANVGTGIVVTANLTGLTLSNGNYYIANVASPLTANITPAPVTIAGLSAANKVYDTTTAAVLSGTPAIASGLLGSDSATVSGAAGLGTFASANVGTGLLVTANLSGLILSNPNYYVTSVASPLTANITPAPVTIAGLSVANKVYDTTTAALLSGTPAIASGLLGSDTAAVSGVASIGSFASANVGTGLLVAANMNSLTLSNGNYYIANVASPLTANITPAPVTITSLSAANKVYDTTTAAVLSGTPTIASGLLGSDSASVSGTAGVGTFAGANVGNGITVTANLSGLTLSNGNYYIANVLSPLTANITPAPVTITGLSAANKVYDATTTATINGILNIAGLLST